MHFLKYFSIFIAISIFLSIFIYFITGGNVLFIMGGIPLIFGGFWTVKHNNK